MARGLRKIEQREEQDRLGVVYSSPRLAVSLACVMRIVAERRERVLFLLVSCTAFLCFHSGKKQGFLHRHRIFVGTGVFG